LMLAASAIEHRRATQTTEIVRPDLEVTASSSAVMDSR
jgi:hypothetical protein